MDPGAVPAGEFDVLRAHLLNQNVINPLPIGLVEPWIIPQNAHELIFLNILDSCYFPSDDIEQWLTIDKELPDSEEGPSWHLLAIDHLFILNGDMVQLRQIQSGLYHHIPTIDALPLVEELGVDDLAELLLEVGFQFAASGDVAQELETHDEVLLETPVEFTTNVAGHHILQFLLGADHFQGGGEGMLQEDVVLLHLIVRDGLVLSQLLQSDEGGYLLVLLEHSVEHDQDLFCEVPEDDCHCEVGEAVPGHGEGATG